MKTNNVIKKSGLGAITVFASLCMLLSANFSSAQGLASTDAKPSTVSTGSTQGLSSIYPGNSVTGRGTRSCGGTAGTCAGCTKQDKKDAEQAAIDNWKDNCQQFCEAKNDVQNNRCYKRNPNVNPSRRGATCKQVAPVGDTYVAEVTKRCSCKRTPC